MAKRFTDTNKYKKPFIRSLSAGYKLLWDFLYHDCDHAGIWIVDFQIAQAYVGRDVKINAKMALSLFNESEQRIIEIDGGKKWFIPSFIEFQYGKQLVSKNRMHVPIINILNKFDLLPYVDIEIVDEGTTISAYRARITKKVKEEILLRDNFKCQYCSNQFEFAELIVDHIQPLDKGGNNDYDNLCACCVRCNSHKTNLDLSDFLSRKHSFLNPTDFLNKKLEGASNKLHGAYNILVGAMDKEQELGKRVNSQEQDLGKSENPLKNFPLLDENDLLSELPKKQKQAAKENFKLQTNHLLTDDEINTFWGIFKVQNVNGKKYYADVGAVYAHFINWIKGQKISNATTNNSIKLGTSAARVQAAKNW